MTDKNKAILISEICIAIAGCTFFPFLWNHAYYHLMAGAHVLLWIFIWRETKGHKIAQIGFWFSLNSLVDELFFDATKIGINEYIFAIVVVWITLRKSKDGTAAHRRNNRGIN